MGTEPVTPEEAKEREMHELARRAFDKGNQDYLNSRILRIQQRLEEFGEQNFYVSFSGGKDSTVVHRILDMAVPGNHIPRVFIRTGIELVSVVDFVESIAEKDERIHIITPKENIRQTLERSGYPFKSKTHSRKVDVYQRCGMIKGVRNYLDDEDPRHFRFRCPPKLRYQFTEENKLRISAWCCVYMKEDPIRLWARSLGYKIGITGLRQAEGGSRSNVQCLSQRKNEKIPRFFNPIAKASDDFMEWFVRKYDVRLPIVYYPPYNFERTGCKGCPFQINLQHELDVLEKYFPEERKQCEIIWKPVYDEYRRIGYRLRREKNENS